MAKSLENLGNEFETTNHENTTTAEKNESTVHMIGVMAILCNFGYEIQNSVAMATSLVNCNTTEIADRQATSRFTNIEYAVHTTGVLTKFMQ